MTDAAACATCTPGHSERKRLCSNCFMLWYDSGIVYAPELAREARWRKANGFFPFGDKLFPTVEQIREMEKEPLPDLEGEYAND